VLTTSFRPAAAANTSDKILLSDLGPRAVATTTTREDFSFTNIGEQVRHKPIPDAHDATIFQILASTPQHSLIQLSSS
jgi:hypothetical protein